MLQPHLLLPLHHLLSSYPDRRLFVRRSANETYGKRSIAPKYISTYLLLLGLANNELVHGR